VFGPLGMHDTFSAPGKPSARAATGYALEHGRFVAQSGSPFDNVCGSGSFWSTVTDLCAYDAALRTHRLVSAQSMREALTRGVGRWCRKTDYGFGWYIADDYMEHLGAWTGFTAYVRRYFDGQLSIYALSNNPGIQVDAIVEEILEGSASLTS
jgi:CubicO group peptidase (beta-lactamase class C family)